MTVLEVQCERKPYKIMDRSREIKKGVMAETLDELIERGERSTSKVKQKIQLGEKFSSRSLKKIIRERVAVHFLQEEKHAAC